MVVTDRVTGLAVELIIADGVYGVQASVATPSDEPVLIDAVTGDTYKVFVSDGVPAWEPFEGAGVASITIVDASTSAPWLLKVIDGVMSYSYAFTLTTARNSKVATGITGTSAHAASIGKESKSVTSISLESKVN